MSRRGVVWSCVGLTLLTHAPIQAQAPLEAAASAADTVPSDSDPATSDGTAEPPAPEHDWIDDLSVRAFVDAYAAEHWTLADGFQGDHAAQLPERAYDVIGGPTVALMALDATYAPQPIGATLGLRFGTAEYRWLGAASGLPQGLQFLHQAFVSWRPAPEVQIDFGEFTTPIGAEVGETFSNVTYSLGSLFQLVQPFYHAGFRVSWTPVDGVTFVALAVNGYNNVVDNNDGKTGGLQGSFRVGPATILVAYMAGPEQAAMRGGPGVPAVPGVDGRMRHLADLVVTLEGGPVRVVLNSTVRVEDMGGAWTTLYGPAFVAGPSGPQYQTLYGVSVGARVQAIDELAVGGRLEYVGQPDLPTSLGRDLVTGTLTLDVLPVEHLVIRLDNRLDWLGAPLFPAPDQPGLATGAMGTHMDLAVSTVLGIVVRSD